MQRKQEGVARRQIFREHQLFAESGPVIHDQRAHQVGSYCGGIIRGMVRIVTTDNSSSSVLNLDQGIRRNRNP